MDNKNQIILLVWTGKLRRLLPRPPGSVQVAASRLPNRRLRLEKFRQPSPHPEDLDLRRPPSPQRRHLHHRSHLLLPPNLLDRLSSNFLGRTPRRRRLRKHLLQNLFRSSRWRQTVFHGGYRLRGFHRHHTRRNFRYACSQRHLRFAQAEPD